MQQEKIDMRVLVNGSLAVICEVDMNVVPRLGYFCVR